MAIADPNPGAAEPAADFVVRRRVIAQIPEVMPTPGELAAHRALQAVLLHVIAHHLQDTDPGALDRALRAAADAGLSEPVAASLERLDADFAIRGPSADIAGRCAALLLLGALLDNAGLEPQAYLLAHPNVTTGSATRALLDVLQEALVGVGAGPHGKPLPAFLREPAEACPDSISGQLAYVLQAWPEYVPEGLRMSVLRATDVLAEEQTARFSGPGEPEVLHFGGAVGEDVGEPQFSHDHDWMPNVIIIAKQTLVWLDQLSKTYGVPVNTLADIPDEELAELARRGFNALWLIGVWERSHASREIKRRMGNPEAEASAYALWDYRIAEGLGGDEAWRNLSERATRHGIRLASDMVPNHVGVDGSCSARSRRSTTASTGRTCAWTSASACTSTTATGTTATRPSSSSAWIT